MGEKGPQKIAVIGNGGGGKTTLSRQLAKLHQLPLLHVDSIQYVAGMKPRSESETRQHLEEFSQQSRWLIDGFGPWDVIESRFQMADAIVFVDFPLWRHYWWCTKRQLMSAVRPREELPEGCSEASLQHTMALYKVLWRVHTKIRPKILESLSNPRLPGTVWYVRSLKEWDSLFNNGCSSGLM